MTGSGRVSLGRSRQPLSLDTKGLVLDTRLGFVPERQPTIDLGDRSAPARPGMTGPPSSSIAVKPSDRGEVPTPYAVRSIPAIADERAPPERVMTRVHGQEPPVSPGIDLAPLALLSCDAPLVVVPARAPCSRQTS